ncbi:MAG TPA: hypothetical protein EYN79_01130 [Planctomycetes bacterium]|nr:hypothetical protein [Planctomycetota bacterium]HIN80677.1 hypothetical protein [Planctomycetota bacterium]
MLPILEKTVWILAAVVLAGLAIFVTVYGMPSSTPSIAMNSREVSEQDLRRELNSDQIRELDLILAGSASENGNATSRRGAPGRRRGVTKVYKVNQGLMDRLKNLTDCQQELSHASSRVRENTDGTISLEVFDITPGSLLERIGLRDNDSIEMVDGQRLDFNSLPAVLSAWESGVDRLDGGGPIVIEINRRGQKVQLVVSPDL